MLREWNCLQGDCELTLVMALMMLGQTGARVAGHCRYWKKYVQRELLRLCRHSMADLEVPLLDMNHSSPRPASLGLV